MLLLSALALGLTLVACKGKTDLTTTLVIKKEQLQSKIATKFPMTQENPPVKIHIINPKLELSDGSDRLGLNVDLKVDTPTKKVGRREVGGMTLTGEALVTGTLNYDKNEGVIYFENGTLDKLKMDQLPAKMQAQVNAMATEKVRLQLAKLPVFTLDEANLEEKAAKALLQSVTVSGGALHVVVGYAN